MTYPTVRRDVLRRKVQKGLMEGQKQNGDWIPAIFSLPGEFIQGYMNFSERDFKSGVGSAWNNPDGTITLYIHSNKIIDLREI